MLNWSGSRLGPSDSGRVSSTVTRGYPPYPVISFAHWLPVSTGRTEHESLSNRLIGHYSLRGQTTCGTLVGRIFRYDAHQIILVGQVQVQYNAASPAVTALF